LGAEENLEAERKRERERERESRGGFEGAWKVEIWVLVALFLPA